MIPQPADAPLLDTHFDGDSGPAARSHIQGGLAIALANRELFHPVWTRQHRFVDHGRPGTSYVETPKSSCSVPPLAEAGTPTYRITSTDSPAGTVIGGPPAGW